MKNKLLVLLLVSILLLLLFFSASVSAKVYYLEDKCIIFVKSDRMIFFSIFNGKVIGGYIVETDMSRVVGIEYGVSSYCDEETGKTQTGFQAQIIIQNIVPGVKTRIISFGESNKMNIGVCFDYPAENSEKNL